MVKTVNQLCEIFFANLLLNMKWFLSISISRGGRHPLRIWPWKWKFTVRDSSLESKKKVFFFDVFRNKIEFETLVECMNSLLHSNIPRQTIRDCLNVEAQYLYYKTEQFEPRRLRRRQRRGGGLQQHTGKDLQFGLPCQKLCCFDYRLVLIFR